MQEKLFSVIVTNMLLNFLQLVASFRPSYESRQFSKMLCEKEKLPFSSPLYRTF